jgi:DNA-binding PadR family transcriptional regulator
VPQTPDPSTFLPLNPPALHVLLVLGERRMHGYAMMEELERRTGGAATLLPGTLYTTLARLLEQGLVREVPAPDYDRQGGPRRYYERTGLGRAVAGAESERLDAIVRLAVDDGLISARAAGVDDGVIAGRRVGGYDDTMAGPAVGKPPA